MDNGRKRTSFWQRGIIIFIVVALIVVTLVLTYSTNNLIREKNEKEETLREEQLKYDELEERYNSEIDDEYIEEAAREKGYNKQDEVVFYNNLPES